MSAAVQVLVDRPVDDPLVCTVPHAGVASAGAPVPAEASSPDDLTAAIASAMTLFGRCQVRQFIAVPQFSNGRWIGSPTTEVVGS